RVSSLSSPRRSVRSDVARMERSAMRGRPLRSARPFPDFAALHPGYGETTTLSPAVTQGKFTAFSHRMEGWLMFLMRHVAIAFAAALALGAGDLRAQDKLVVSIWGGNWKDGADKVI